MQIYIIKVIQKNNIHEKFIFLYEKFIVDLYQKYIIMEKNNKKVMYKVFKLLNERS